MKFVRSLLCVAAVTFAATLHAQQAPPAAPKPAVVKDEAAKPKKAPPTAAELEKSKVHLLAAMEVKIGGGSTEDILIELLPDAAPKTVENFVTNAKKGLYTGLAFHRTIKDYLIQTGDPKSKDQALHDQWGLSQEYTIPAEIKLNHMAGAVAMARRSQKVNPKLDSDGTQFYIGVGNLAALNGSYTVFGQVVSGLDIAKRISELPADSNDCPLARVEIKKLVISEQKGPLITMVKVGKKKRQTKPESLKGPLEKFLERIW